MNKELRHRIIFGFIALLFIATAFVGVYAFVVNTHQPSPESNYISCGKINVGQQKTGKNGRYEGAQLVDFKPVKHISYVQCQDVKVGTGKVVTAQSTITATYTGALATTGKIFQSSLDTGQPFTTQLSGVIPGWTAGIPGMKVGGTRRLLIPAQYAYGAQGSCQQVDQKDSSKCVQYSIPPNADLVFDVTLLNVK
jgi:FKBP-type peptidyl-prolyl cis-trans isomerase